jgi:hypothetical protein
MHFTSLLGALVPLCIALLWCNSRCWTLTWFGIEDQLPSLGSMCFNPSTVLLSSLLQASCHPWRPQVSAARTVICCLGCTSVHCPVGCAHAKNEILRFRKMTTVLSYVSLLVDASMQIWSSGRPWAAAYVCNRSRAECSSMLQQPLAWRALLRNTCIPFSPLQPLPAAFSSACTPVLRSSLLNPRAS